MDHAANCCSIVELREYTLHPGAREDLIELFDREFIESQEALGIHVIGQFRDIDRPDRFVWLRGFTDMDSRLAALTAFYSGPVWAEYKDAANATMIDSDNVLLLRPSSSGSGFVHPPEGSRDNPRPPRRSYVITVRSRLGAPGVGAIDGVLVADLVTEPSENTYPRLPIREDQDVAVTVHRVVDDVELSNGAVVMRLVPTARSEL